MTLPSDILDAAIHLMPTPAQWTTGALARDSDGIEVYELAPSAVCWCMFGAVAQVASEAPHSYRAVHLAKTAMRDAVFATGEIMDVDQYNDAPGRTHPEVIAVLTRARDRLREAGR